MASEMVQPYTRVSSDDVTPYVVVSSSKRLIEALAKELKDARRISGTDPFLTVTGDYKDAPITLGYSGLGASSLAILLEEYIRAGAKVVIKIDTGISLTPTINIGSIVLACSAARGEGASRTYAPLEFPACGNYYLLRFLEDMFKARELNFQIGVVLSTDAYHLSEEDEVKKWRKINVIAMDVDTATLYVISALRRIRSASVLVIDGNLAKGIGRGEIYVDEDKLDLARKVEDRLLEVGRVTLDTLRLLREKSRLEAELAVSREVEGI